MKSERPPSPYVELVVIRGSLLRIFALGHGDGVSFDTPKMEALLHEEISEHKCTLEVASVRTGDDVLGFSLKGFDEASVEIEPNQVTSLATKEGEKILIGYTHFRSTWRTEKNVLRRLANFLTRIS